MHGLHVHVVLTVLGFGTCGALVGDLVQQVELSRRMYVSEFNCDDEQAMAGAAS